jgi:ABC-type glycerol-3-phosphate transport system substrate-binding protein
MSEDSQKKPSSSASRVSRRRFLHIAGAGATGVLLAACAPAAAPAAPAATTAPAAGGEATQAPEPTTAPAAAGAGGEVILLIRQDIKDAYAADAAVKEFNASFPTQISLEVPPTGDAPDTKIQAAQAAGDLLWSGYAVMETPWATKQYVTRKLIQPLDDLIKSSTIPNADKVVPGIIPTILESSKYEGKQYSIPGNVGSIALAWQAKVLEEVGVKEQPLTWDEIYETAKLVKAAKPELTPFDSAGAPLCDLYAQIWGGQDNPFTADGLIDITGPVAIEAVEWQQKMVKEGLMPAVHTDSFGNWLKGGTAMIISFDVAGTFYEKTFGKGTAPTGTSMFKEKGNTRAGVPYWMNAMVTLNGAKNAQGMTDFYLWWVGPDNKASAQQFSEVAAKPCYQYQYDAFIAGKPEHAWQLQGIDLIRKSVGFNVDQPTTAQFDPTRAQLERALDPANNVDAKTAMDQAMTDLKDVIAKMK